MQADEGFITIAPLTTNWSYISIVSDGSTTKAYFNGVLVDSKNWVEDGWDRIELGRNRNENNPGNYTVDEVSIWNTARTESEIQQDMVNIILQKWQYTQLGMEMVQQLNYKGRQQRAVGLI